MSIKEAQEVQKSYYDQSIGGPSIKECDLVLLRDQRSKKGLSRKLLNKFIGPFRVRRVVSPNADLTELDGSKPKRVHINRLKPFVGREKELETPPEQSTVSNPLTSQQSIVHTNSQHYNLRPRRK